MKIFTLTNLLATAMLATGVTAQAAEAASIKILEDMTGEDGRTYQAVAQAISPNHRYVAGPAFDMSTGMMGMFVYDVETGDYAVKPANDDYGADIREVNDDGVATGYNSQACFLHLDGTVEYIEAEEGITTQARDASDDLSVVVGCTYPTDGFNTTACVWVDGEKTDLPVPTDEELGFETNGSVAYYTNSDGSVIAGYVVDNYSTNPLLIWRLQDDGSYVCDPVCTRYFSPNGDMEGRPYVMFAAQGLSRNGRYVSLNVMDASSGLYEQRIGRLDLETGEVETYVADGSGDIQANAEMQATQVSNDGTIIGWSLAGSWAMQVRSAVIWYKGEDPKLLSNVVPDVEEIANFDSLGFNTVIDITPDGRYVVGFAMDEMSNYKGYVLDLGTASSAVNEVVKEDAEAYEVARYAINGTRLQAPTKGINIVKMSDGTTKKVIVKE